MPDVDPASAEGAELVEPGPVVSASDDGPADPAGPAPAGATGAIWTIGHWTCPIPVFLDALAQAGIEVVVDVRAQPGSRRSPQFSRDAMPGWLAAEGLDYVHLPALAGRRRKQPGAPADLNGGWQNQSFHNYADYTLRPEYEDGIAQLTDLARHRRVAVMCGEPMPWRCHRLLIANTLTARGWDVVHLSSTGAPRRHELGAWGATPVVRDGVVTYPQVDADADADADAEAVAAPESDPAPDAEHARTA